MKRITLMIICSFLLFSCGNRKNEVVTKGESVKDADKNEAVIVDTVNSQYDLEMIFENVEDTPIVSINPLKMTNGKNWIFTYGNDKYGRPISMENTKDTLELYLTNTMRQYDIEYTSSGYHIIGYDYKRRKVYDYESNNSDDFVDLRNWNFKFNIGGKLKKYNYDLVRGNLSSITYYNENQTCYLLESRNYDGSPDFTGIFKKTKKPSFYNDRLIKIGWEGKVTDNHYPIYRIDHSSGTETQIANVPKNKLRSYLLDYLYNLN